MKPTFKNLLISSISHLIFAFAFAASSHAQNEIKSQWNKLETAIEKHEFKSFDLDNFLEIPEAKTFYETDNLDVYWKMTGQEKYPLIQLAGFAFLKEKDAKSATDAAIYLVMGSKKTPLQFLDSVYGMLSSNNSRSLWLPRITEIARAHPGDIKRWSLLISIAKKQELYVWINAHSGDSMDFDYKAMILDEVLTNPTADQPLTPAMQELLAKCRKVAGHPRLVYALHADVNDADFQRDLESVLLDPDLSSTSKLILVMRRKAYILSEVKWKDMKLDEPLQRFLEKPEK